MSMRNFTTRILTAGITAAFILSVSVSCSILPGKTGAARKGKGPVPQKQMSGSVLNVSFEFPVESLDQQKAVYADSFEVIGHLIDGLMQMGDDGSVQKAICKEETVSADGLHYTFILRDDAFWSNGEPVTAHDFVYGWQRAIDPATNSEYAFMLSDIAHVKNARAIQVGRMDPNQLGVRAVDDYTFQVELEVPVSYFNELLYFCTFFPANRKFIEKCGDSYGTSPDTYLSNGAFILTEYAENAKSVTLVKNSAYYAASSVKIAGIHFQIIDGNNDGVQRYKNGTLDITTLDKELYQEMQSSPDFKSVATGFLYYIPFNLDRPMLQNRNLRKAIMFAFDRKLVAEVLGDGSNAAWTAVPSGFAFNAGGNDFSKSGIEFPEYCSFDPERALEYYEQARKELGQSRFTIEFMVSEVPDQVTVAENIKEQLERNLPGMKIELRKVPRSERRKIMASGDFEIGLTNWGPDYADPMTYLAMWMTGNDNNNGNYSDPKYDAIIASCQAGDLCTKLEERWAAMKQAEIMIMDNVVVMPVYQKAEAYLIKPNVRNIAFHSIAMNRCYKNAVKQ